MKSTYCALSVWLSGALLAALLGASACSGSDLTPSGSAGASAQAGGASAGGAASADACTVDDDCTLGEIEIEITKASDCMCLYGCVYWPETKLTAARRMQQYQKFCKPDVDGQGEACGIDDCAVPGGVSCVAGSCQASTSAR